jgi:ribosomal-protein-serine acetyltransferase
MNICPETTIRPYRVADAEEVYAAVRESMAELSPWMPWCHPGYSIEETRAWIESQIPAFLQATAFEFAIVSASGRYLGACGLNQIDKGNRRANLGYWIRSSAACHGSATAAVKLLQAWAMKSTDLIRLEIVIAVENRKSRRVAEKAGADFEAVLRNRLWLQDKPCDAAIYSFIR